MIRIYNGIIKQRQIVRKKTRKKLVLEYKERN